MHYTQTTNVSMIRRSWYINGTDTGMYLRYRVLGVSVSPFRSNTRNSYAPAHTFASRDKRALVSFDYYLSPTQPEDEAAADLEELAVINGRRPYFLLVHVRNFSDIRRVQRVLDRLSPQFELVPLDVFMKMAGERPTFTERYLEEQPPRTPS